MWLVNQDHEDRRERSAERLGDCGLFLGARSALDADIWRAFYRYARLVLRLGHVDTWIDDDITLRRALVERERVQLGTSKVCLWWSEFDLDDEEYSCRPKRDASNIVTPSILLATLAEEQGGLPAALAAATLSAQPPASALAAARLDPLRALGRREHQGLQGARV